MADNPRYVDLIMLRIQLESRLNGTLAKGKELGFSRRGKSREAAFRDMLRQVEEELWNEWGYQRERKEWR